MRRGELAAYLDRIGYTGTPDATIETLRVLHVAHLMSVPFENLDIHLGRTIVLDESHLFEKIVRQRRGGFCYELNGLFAGMLCALGFRVAMLSAGVARKSGGFGPEFDHMTLAVDIGEEQWLADVGFGDGFLEPLRLTAGGKGEYHLRRDERWILLSGDEPQYRFTLTPHRLADYADMCRYHQTSPESSFTRGRLATRATADGRITVTDHRLIVTRRGVRQEREIAGEQEFKQICGEHFGLRWE